VVLCISVHPTSKRGVLVNLLTKKWFPGTLLGTWLGRGGVDGGSVNAFLAAALTRVMRAVVPIPTVASAFVLHSAAVGGFHRCCGAPLDIWGA